MLPFFLCVTYFNYTALLMEILIHLIYSYKSILLIMFFLRWYCTIFIYSKERGAESENVICIVFVGATEERANLLPRFYELNFTLHRTLWSFFPHFMPYGCCHTTQTPPRPLCVCPCTYSFLSVGTEYVRERTFFFSLSVPRIRNSVLLLNMKGVVLELLW